MALINSCVCVLQVPVTVADVSALPRTGGCLESTVNVMTDCVTNTTASSVQVIRRRRWKYHIYIKKIKESNQINNS